MQQMDQNLYEVLGVTEDADTKTISRAYKKLAKELHPDVRPDDPQAADHFKDITAAYDVLGDDAKRAEYDQFRAMGGPSGFGPAYNNTAADQDLHAMFEDLLAGHGAGFHPNGGRFGQWVAPAPALITNLTIDLAEAHRGVTVSVQGPAGPIAVPIPAGIDDGQQLLVPGVIPPSETDHHSHPADLLVVVAVRTNPMFTREGDNLRCTMPVAFSEAVLGATLTVPTIDGDTVKIRVPQGTPSGRTLRVRGRGMPSESGTTGDLLVTVNVAVPTELTEEQAEAMAAWAEVEPRS